MILAIDFDGVIHDRAHPIPGKKMGEPLPGALEALQDLYDAGHKLIIHTAMANTPSGKQAVEDWLDHFGVDYHSVVPKPRADFYIDDHAVLHATWPQTLAAIGYVENDDAW